MITVNKIGNNPNTLYVTLYGTSTDTKPTVIQDMNVANGSVFIEIDTGNKFYFDAENMVWC